MNFNKKLVVSALALCMGAGLAGSVTGTIAWYQYSTRSSVAMLGTSVGVMKNLQVKVGADGTWSKDLKKTDISAYLEAETTYSKGDLQPVTTGAMDKNVALPEIMRGNPIYQHAEIASWPKAEKTHYVVLPIYVRAVKAGKTLSSSSADPEWTADSKDIYLHDVTIQEDKDNTAEDISDAVRVHFACGTTYALAANCDKTVTEGKLDLNFDGVNDQTGHYEWDTPTDITYGGGEQRSYNVKNAGADGLFADDDVNPDTFTQGIKLGTVNSLDGMLINVTIWLEGWAKLNGTDAMWDLADYLDSQFDVGFTFTCPTAEAN